MSKGIDIPIDSLVSDFEANLWTGFNNQFHGRVYRFERFETGKISPEIESTGRESKELLKNDNYDSQCFFDVQPDNSGESVLHTGEVKIVFFVDLKKVYENESPLFTRNEAQEQSHADALARIRLSKIKNTRLIRGFDAVREYDWGEDSIQAQAHCNMSPHYVFALVGDLDYQIIKNC